MRNVSALARASARYLALDVQFGISKAVNSAERSLQIPRVHNLYLHSVSEAEESRFVQFIDWLEETGHTPISYSEGIRRTQEADIDRPYVTFSFDDGYASNRQTADLLAARGINACFFVITDFIGRTDLADARAFLGPGIQEAAMSWDDVDHLLNTGHEIGNHTKEHKNLAALSFEAKTEAILAAADVLDARTGGARHFAWPLGRWFHFDANAMGIVLARHETCASAERGSHPASAGKQEHYCPRRDHIMASWPLRHMQLFTARGAAKGAALGSLAGAWPQEW